LTQDFNSRLDALPRALQNHVLVGTRNQHDANAIHAAIESVASGIASRHRRTPRLLLLGIANGGVELADRLARRLQKLGVDSSRGTIDISFHRDDIGRQPIPKEFAPTIIPHDVNGATVVLVDDVLYSGRTVKAALDELFDHGRPAAVELAVLVDRGGRCLPFAPNYCGLTVEATESEKVVVHLEPGSPERDFLSIEPKSRAAAPNRKSQL
jgi:pyrimidine operon attenuation protein/uracil phosphoribosyltransferase